MKFFEYLKDRFPIYLICGISWIMIVIFMLAFRISLQSAVIISLILLISLTVCELWEYFRKKNYYDSLLHCLDELDEKYLIPEMIREPEFLSGHILYEILRETNRSMYEHIAEYRRENSEFREYIELWVHEIKLPVASLQLMCHNDNNNKYSEQLRRIDDYIENVLYYARSGDAEKDYIIKPVSLKKIFSGIAVKNRQELQERNVDLHIGNLDVNVMTDGKWLGFILGQLMNNSMKYDATEICITAEDLPDKTVLHFHDNGTGIPENDLPYIFEKSFTGENGRTHKKSTGMGLYIIRKLCGKLGHGISVQSVKGEYTEIIITFGKNDLFDVR